MGEVKCSPGPWKAIENSWQYTTIYDAHDREICRLDLERFEDLNEETQDKYEAIQRADAAAIVRACDHDAALRRAKAEGEDELLKLRIYTQTLQRALRNCHMLARRIVVSESAFFKIDSAHHIIRMCEEAGITKDGVLRDDARAAQIEEGE